jgi:hypothetical protein
MNGPFKLQHWAIDPAYLQTFKYLFKSIWGVQMATNSINNLFSVFFYGPFFLRKWAL